jgi:CheY-like chemotaxis protein
MQREPDAPIVLIVEDEWLIRADIVYEFQAAGWMTVEASSGEEALSILQDGRQIDLLVTDIRLSGLVNGWDVAQAFRKARRDLPVVYASANARDEAQMVPGSVFFSKPFPSSTIVETSSRLVDRSPG